MSETPSNLCPIGEAAPLVGTSSRTLYRRLAAGQLDAWREGGGYRRTLVDLDQVRALFAPEKLTAAPVVNA